MKTQHTPSPWYVTEYAILAHNGGTHILEHPKLKWEKLASITGSRGNIVSKMISECEANARLIAAAPELLAICEEIANDSKCDLANSERRIRLYSALSKAKGKPLT